MSSMTELTRRLAFPLLDRFEAGDFKIFQAAVELRRHPGTGALHRYSVLSCPHWVNVIARTAEGDYVFVRQWRAGTDEITLEIPGGMVDPGEDPVAAGVRELVEETGYQGSNPSLLGAVEPNPAFQNNRCSTVIIDNCNPVAAPSLDAGEYIEVCTLTSDEVRSALIKGEILHALVVAAFAHLMLKDTL